MEEGFHLNKREFWDSLALRYNWPLQYLPSSCPCGNKFDICHALSCKKGGFITLRHNEVRDTTTDLLSDVCRGVDTEPYLEPLTGENLQAPDILTDEARIDIVARDFWTRGQLAFFDVRVFNPFAKRHVNKSLAKMFEGNEKEKKRVFRFCTIR